MKLEAMQVLNRGPNPSRELAALKAFAELLALCVPGARCL